MPDLGISIVNFNSGNFLVKCLDALEAVKNEAILQIWVFDNASSDGSLELAKKKFPKLNYIKNDQNLGFSKAHNLVLKKIKNEYVLVLNPDTEIKKAVLSTMVKFMEENPEVGAASCQVILENGQMDLASHRGFPTPWAAFKYYFLKDDSLYHLTNRKMDQPHEVDAISGAFFLTRKEILKKLGYFDEDYFMYAEDIDLCFRIKEAGFKVMYVPTVKIVHHKGISSGIKKHSRHLTTTNNLARFKALDAFYETMIIFYRKHMAEKYPFFINWLVYFGVNVKWLLAKRKMQV